MKLLAIVIILLYSISASSQFISEANAIDVASNLMEGLKGKGSISNIVLEKYKGNNSFYVVNFENGGWVMVSSKKSTIPILAYSYNGIYRFEDIKPPPLENLLVLYKEKIHHAKSEFAENKAIKEQWNKALNETFSGNFMRKSGYTGNILEYSGQAIKWGQSKNNNEGCSPAYNDLIPSGLLGCECPNNKKPVGCGSVALGQVMLYWLWPDESAHRTYDWNNMAAKLENSTNSTKANNVAQLLRDCYDDCAKNIIPFTSTCGHTASTMNSIESALNNDYTYESARKLIKNDWDYGTSWVDLLSSEIYQGRPVIYRGDKCDVCPEKHEWVIVGYSGFGDLFSMNFGWADYDITECSLGDITPSDYDFNENQQAIVGISPTFAEDIPSNVNIYSLPYTSISGSISEEAQKKIQIPQSGSTLTIMNSGNLTLEAGESIRLNPGFKVNSGGSLSCAINTNLKSQYNIEVNSWPTSFSPDNDGINDVLEYETDNSNSWEFNAKQGSNIIFQSAGSITNNSAIVWEGEEASSGNTYECTIIFKNNSGRDIENTYNISVN